MWKCIKSKQTGPLLNSNQMFCQLKGKSWIGSLIRIEMFLYLYNCSGECKNARGTIKVEELRFTAVLCTSVTWRFKWHLKQFKTLLYFIKHAKLIFAASGHGQPWQPNFTECISGILLDIHVYRKYNHSPFFFNWFWIISSFVRDGCISSLLSLWTKL